MLFSCLSCFREESRVARYAATLAELPRMEYAGDEKPDCYPYGKDVKTGAFALKGSYNSCFSIRSEVKAVRAYTELLCEPDLCAF
jgi:hypothetical protein